MFGSTHATAGEGNARDPWERYISGSNFSSTLASFCPDICHILSKFSYKLYSAACICLTNKFGNGLHVIPRFPTPCSIVDVSLRRMQHCCGWHQLCHKGGKIMWTLHNHVIVFAHKRPPDNLLCTSTNTVDDTFFMGWGKVFPQNSAIELLDHIVPLVHELWLYDGALLWNISNWVTFCNDIGCVAHITKHVTHVTQHSVTCVTVVLFHVLCIYIFLLIFYIC